MILQAMDVESALKVARHNLELLRSGVASSSADVHDRLSQLMKEKKSLEAELTQILASSQQPERLRTSAGKLHEYALVLYPQVFLLLGFVSPF